MRGLHGQLLFLLEMWIINVLLWSPSLADMLGNTEQEICAQVKHQISENLRLNMKNREGDSNLNSEERNTSDNITDTLRSALQDDTNGTLDIIMSALNNIIPDTENTKNISYNCLVQVATNQPSKTKAKLDLIATLVGTKDGLVNIIDKLNISSVEIGKFLLKTGSDLHAKINDNETVLHLAADKGYLNIVQWLVNEQKMNISEFTQFVGNPLHYAVKSGHFKVVKWLIENTDIDINQRNGNGDTAVLFSYSYTNIAKYLIEDVKVEYDIINNDNLTLLHVAARYGNFELVKYLIEDLKMDMNAQGMENYTTLHFAFEHPEIVKYLLLQGADYNLTSYLQENILHFPVIRGKSYTVMVILENCNLNVNLQDYYGLTALHKGMKFVDIVKILVEIGKINVNIQNFVNYQTALHMASSNGFLESVKYLVENTNADVNAQGKNGNTALHVATRYLEVVQYLVNKVDVNIKNNAGQNVLEKVKDDYDKSDRNERGNEPIHIPGVVRFKNVYDWLVKNVNFTTTS